MRRLLAGFVVALAMAAPLGAATHTPATAAEFQTDLTTDAACGDTIQLAPGTTYDPSGLTSNEFRLTARGCSIGNPITITTSGSVPAVPTCNSSSTVPATVRACWTTWLASVTWPKIRTSTTNEEAIATAFDADGYVFRGIEIHSSDCSRAGSALVSIVLLGEGRGADPTLYPTAVSQVPNGITFDRVYIHGCSTGDSGRGILANAATFSLTNSYINEIHSDNDGDTNCVSESNSPGPMTITNNYLECAGENVGLFANPTIANVVANNVTFSGNYVTKPFSWWVDAADIGETYGGITWQVKNLFELKNATNVTIDGNLFENCWANGQSGHAIVFTVVNQYGTAAVSPDVNCTWCTIQNTTFSNNIVRHAGSGLQVSMSDVAGSATHPTVVGHSLTIHNNLWYDIATVYDGDGRWIEKIIASGTGDAARVGNGLVVTHNTADNDTAGGGMAYTFQDVGATNDTYPSAIWRDNLVRHGNYGFLSDVNGNGTSALTAYYPSVTWTKNALGGMGEAGHFLAEYPASTYAPTNAQFTACFVNRATGDYTLVAGCSDGTNNFNNFGSDGTDIGVNMDALPGWVVGAATPIRLRLRVSTDPPIFQATIPNRTATVSFFHSGDGVTGWGLAVDGQRQRFSATQDANADASGLKLYTGVFSAGVGTHSLAVLPIYGPAGDGPPSLPFSLTVRPAHGRAGQRLGAVMATVAHDHRVPLSLMRQVRIDISDKKRFDERTLRATDLSMGHVKHGGASTMHRWRQSDRSTVLAQMAVSDKHGLIKGSH